MHRSSSAPDRGRRLGQGRYVTLSEENNPLGVGGQLPEVPECGPGESGSCPSDELGSGELSPPRAHAPDEAPATSSDPARAASSGSAQPLGSPPWGVGSPPGSFMERESVISISSETGLAGQRISPYETNPPDDAEGTVLLHLVCL